MTRGAKVGWVILVVSTVLGFLAAVVLIVSPTSILVEPAFAAGNVPGALRAWGATWMFFSVLELVILFRSFRQGEPWAWWVSWLLPLLWLSHFVFNPATVHNLVIAVVTAVGLILSYRAFFSSGGRPTHTS
ncbi:MAG TPA: hypothetical protein VMS99_00405 [Acidimicrobiia bacterium]|nr:hypothetical protein [Acidimicrobiia bacterium]